MKKPAVFFWFRCESTRRYTGNNFSANGSIPFISFQLSLGPLGPGDVIDRAVRFYRRNFWTFVFIAFPPVVMGTVISVGWAFLARSLFSVSSTTNVVDLTFYYLFFWHGTIVIGSSRGSRRLSVMGGASRNFVRHLLFNEPLTFHETYAKTWKRLAGLVTAPSYIAIVLGIVGSVVSYIGFLIGAVLIVLAVAALQMVPPLALLVGVLVGHRHCGRLIWLFF